MGYVPYASKASFRFPGVSKSFIVRYTQFCVQAVPSLSENGPLVKIVLQVLWKNRTRNLGRVRIC